MKTIRKRVFGLGHVLTIALVILLAGCELGVKNEPQPSNEAIPISRAKEVGGLGGGGSSSLVIPVGSNVTGYVNLYNGLYGTTLFYLQTGNYTSSGSLTASGVTITRHGNSTPKINGYFDIHGNNVTISHLTWDGTNWTGHSSVMSPPNRNLILIRGQNVTIEHNKLKNITTLESYTLIRAGGKEYNGYQAFNVSNLKIQYNEIDNWKQPVGSSNQIGAIFLGHFNIDVPEAVGAQIRYNIITDGPDTWPVGGCACGNTAITVADGLPPFPTATYIPTANQAVNIEGNEIDGGLDAFSIKVNNATIKNNIVTNSTSGSSPGIQNRIGSNNIFDGNMVSGASDGAGIMIWAGNNLTFRNNIIRDSEHGILFRSESSGPAGDHILINNNTFVGNIDNVVFYNSQGAAYAHDDVVFINNIFYKDSISSSPSFKNYPGAPSFSIWSSISYMGYNLFANGFSAPSGGTCHSCPAPASTVQIFDNIAANNFDIETGSSPAVNAGTNWSNGMPSIDFEKKVRPVGPYDIGAIEKNGY